MSAGGHCLAGEPWSSGWLPPALPAQPPAAPGLARSTGSQVCHYLGTGSGWGASSSNLEKLFTKLRNIEKFSAYLFLGHHISPSH